MSDLITETIQNANVSQMNTVKHDMSVKIDGTSVVETAIQTWGKTLQNSRAAPNWYRVEPYIDDINASESKLTVVTDQNGKGALQFSFSEKQMQAFSELKSLLVELANKVYVAKETQDKASISFDDVIKNAQPQEAFDADMGGLAVSTFLEKTSGINPSITHEKYGELDAKSLVSLSKIKAPSLAAGDPDSDEAIAAQMPKAIPATDISRYQSMGQMVKAGDAKALSEYIDWAKKEKHWDESKKDACSKLGWVAASIGNIDTMRVLLDKGKADIDFAAQEGITPLMAAVANNFPDMIDFLIAEGADKKKTPIDGRSAMMLAASHDAVDSIKKLHSLGFDLNEVSLEGRTALHHAALGEDDTTAINSIKTLIELGANPTIIDAIGAEGGCLAEEYINEGEQNDQAYATLSQFRKDWEAGKTGPQSTTSSAISKARSMLGF